MTKFCIFLCIFLTYALATTMSQSVKDFCDQGDGIGGYEIHLGIAADRNDCVNKVKNQKPMANGATFKTCGGGDNSGCGNCFAEFDMNDRNDNENFESCIFAVVSPDCKTISGPDPNKPCIFPFNVNRVPYHACTTDHNEPGDTTAWCATMVDEMGNAANWDAGKWGNCEEKCQQGIVQNDEVLLEIKNLVDDFNDLLNKYFCGDQFWPVDEYAPEASYTAIKHNLDIMFGLFGGLCVIDYGYGFK